MTYQCQLWNTIEAMMVLPTDLVPIIAAYAARTEEERMAAMLRAIGSNSRLAMGLGDGDSLTIRWDAKVRRTTQPRDYLCKLYKIHIEAGHPRTAKRPFYVLTIHDLLPSAQMDPQSRMIQSVLNIGERWGYPPWYLCRIQTKYKAHVEKLLTGF